MIVVLNTLDLPKHVWVAWVGDELHRRQLLERVLLSAAQAPLDDLLPHDFDGDVAIRNTRVVIAGRPQHDGMLDVTCVVRPSQEEHATKPQQSEHPAHIGQTNPSQTNTKYSPNVP